MITGFSHVMLYVTDMSRAVRWYEQSLGFQARFLAAPHYASMWHDRLNLRIDLHPDTGGNVGRGAMIYFAAENLDQTIAELRQRGIQVSDPRSRGNSPRFTEFADSEGNTLGIYEQTPTSP